MEADWELNSNCGEDYNLLEIEPKIFINSSPIDVSSDGINLLPTDDQLDQLVDNLCDTFPSLKVTFDKDQNHNTSSDSSGHGSLDLAQDQTTLSLIDSTISSALVRSNVLLKNVDVSLPKKKAQLALGKRLTLNAGLNKSMIRCLHYLERLSETRKSLEAHVCFQPHILSSITRLPQSPTRVDRLIFEVDRERSKVLGLVATLESTVQAFSSASTKDDLRCMLERFRRTIVDVMKERHNEVDALESGTNPETRNRSTKLAQSINAVIPHIKEANTALWCLKQQVLTIKSRKRCLKGICSTQSAAMANIPTVEPANGAALVSTNLTHPLVKTGAQPRSSADNESDDGNENKSRMKSRRELCSVTVMGAPRINVLPSTSQSLSFPFRSKKSSAMQLAQQQRAEIFQRYASVLTGARKDSIVK